jgi:hypothetical protein
MVVVMKITKKQLQEIIKEELANSLEEINARNFITKGMEKLKTPFGGNVYWRQKAGYEPSKPPPPVDQKRVIELTSKFISQFQTELMNNQRFKNTPLYKKVIVPLQEDITTDQEKAFIKDLTRDIKIKKITVPEIVQSIQAIAKDPEFRGYITSLSDDAEKVFGLESQQDAPSSQQPAAQQPATAQQTPSTQPAAAQQSSAQQGDDFDIDEGTPVEFAVNDLNKFLIDKGSVDLIQLLSSDKGVEFTRKIKDDMLKSDKQTFEIFEQNQETEQLFIISAINDLVGDNVTLKEELLKLLLQWSDNKPEVIVNSQELKNELQNIQQAQPEEEPPELPSAQPAAGQAAPTDQTQPNFASSQGEEFVDSVIRWGKRNLKDIKPFQPLLDKIRQMFASEKAIFRENQMPGLNIRAELEKINAPEEDKIKLHGFIKKLSTWYSEQRTSEFNPVKVISSMRDMEQTTKIARDELSNKSSKSPNVQQGQPTELSSTSNLFVKKDNYPIELAKYKEIIKPNNEVAFRKVMNFLFKKGLLLRPPEREMSLNEQEQQINNVKQPLVLVQKLAPEIKGQQGLRFYLMPLMQTLAQMPKTEDKVGYKDSFPIFWKLFQMKRLYLPADWKQTVSNPKFVNVGEIDRERQRQKFTQDQPMDESLAESRRWQKLAGIIKD